MPQIFPFNLRRSVVDSLYVEARGMQTTISACGECKQLEGEIAQAVERSRKAESEFERAASRNRQAGPVLDELAKAWIAERAAMEKLDHHKLEHRP